MHSTQPALPFAKALKDRWARSNSLLCVGLDPDLQRIPASLRERADGIYEFCKAIVDATHDLVCAFKPQIAFFAAERAEDQLEAVIAYIKSHYPGVVVVLDAKRGDVGSTAEYYAREVFERYKADAVTLSPYLGSDSIEPFLSYRGKGSIILCRTSNPGGSDVQFLDCEGSPVFELVANMVARRWNALGQCGLVVGATFPRELSRVRDLVDDMPILVPGIGAQGGDIQATVVGGKTDAGGLMISSSRAILYASGGEDFADAARRVALETRDEINRHR
ncbi:MAG: orotidine-5'-phosphate decarboxylase [Burkholderiaceae bacterium]|jgi:orotidine-5'-phosphate decarboxylase